MSEPVIICPKCKTEIKLTESLAAPLIEAARQEFEQKLAAQETDVVRRESEILEQQRAIDKDRLELENQVAAGIRRERDKIAAEEAQKARLLVSDELDGKAKEVADLQTILKVKNDKLAEAQSAQAEIVRKLRELEDAKRALELTVEQRVQQSLSEVREKAKRDVQEELKLKIAEREETIAGMQRQIELLKQKAEQGSQQIQGEVQELELERLLSAKFPTDVIEPVPKGEFGGDVLHEVIGPSGHLSGKILWESKRTKNWSDTWLGKLRNDQRGAKADVAVLVSRALPNNIESFGLMDGVWVIAPRYVIPVAIVLRQSLIEIASARQAGEGQQTKMGLMYTYLTGPHFRAHIEAIVEKFTDMQEDLNRERKAMTRLWAKREEQIRGVIDSTAGMYGDLQGIAGKTLHEVEGLNMPVLPAANPTCSTS